MSVTGSTLSLRFLLDESTNYQIAPHLRRLGHNVTAIGQDYPASLKDRVILEIAHRENRIVITNDRDFGEMVVRESLAHTGVMLFRLGSVTTQEFIQRLDVVLAEHADALGSFLVVSRTRVRIRRLRPIIMRDDADTDPSREAPGAVPSRGETLERPT